MENTLIPEDVQRFILVSVPSVPFLEAMLLVRNEPEHGWNKRLLAKRLYVTEKAAADLLQALSDGGILKEDSRMIENYHYDPHSDELDAMIARVSIAYARNLIDVTNLIHSQTAKKALRFADAFKWRKD